MRTAGISLFSLTLGLTLGACQDPPVEAGDDAGTADTETGDTGDGDGDPAECGNGQVEGDEVCDDGNEVDEDECTNACELAACGDGFIQPTNDEVCDDGNSDPGDGCTASCVLPGELIWEVIVDVNGQSDDVGLEVVLDGDENIGILLRVDGAYQIAEYDPDGNPVWIHPSVNTQMPNLAIGPDDVLVVGGQTNGGQGVTRLYDTDGNQTWSQNVPAANSTVVGVAVDDLGFVISAGYHASTNALLFRDDSGGVEDWSHFEMDGTRLGPVTVGADGQIWVVRANPRQLETYTSDGSAGWESAMLEDAVFEDLVADANGNTYLLSGAKDASLLSISKYDNAGALVWSVDHDDEGVLEIAGGLALLPGGGVIVSGGTNGSLVNVDGLLAWYDGDGDSWAPDVVLDGDLDEDIDVLYDLALGDGYAIAVGGQGPAGGEGELWIRKFEI